MTSDARHRFDFHMKLWGYSVEGTHDIRSRISEEHKEYQGMPAWDDPAMLDEVRLNGKRPPDYFACYWLGEHIRRGHEVSPKR